MRTSLIGQRFGKLLVESFDSALGGRNRWKCICDCGGTSVSNTSDLKSGHSSSCGCVRKERHLKAITTHGMTHSSEFYTWNHMKNRCTNPNSDDYKYYGERGISVCVRWLNSFENFFSDMGYKPTPQHTIERKNNDGNYEPSNCVWATMAEQNKNRRMNI